MPQTQANIPTALEAALDYARCGIPVFPCNPIDKKPLTANGFKDATRDETQILGWWQQYPSAMIGVPMGPASGMWATDLDVDPAKKIDGKATLDQLIAQRGALPPTWTTITPRGGRHLIWIWDPNVEIRQRKQGRSRHRCARKRRVDHPAQKRVSRATRATPTPGRL